MLKYIITGAVLSAALLWSYASDDRIISFIEKDLTTQLNSVAPKTPNDLFDYIIAGRDVIIQIREFGREDEIDTLQQQIASVGGVDNIFLVGSVANPATAPAIAALLRSGSNKLFVEIQIDNNVLTVTGNASDPKATEIVFQKLRDSKGTEVNNYLDFYPGIPSSQWLKHLKILTSRLPTAGNLLITESGVSRHGGLFGKAKIPDSSRAPLQAENTRLTDSDQPDTLLSDPASPVVVADDNTNLNLLAIVNDNAASVEEVVENTDVNQTDSKIVGEEWIAQLDGASFIIQFGTTLDLERVDEFIPVISRGAPIAVYAYKTTPSGRPIYGIATGVYANLSDALDRVTSLPSEARAYNPWIRSIAEVQLQISETHL